MTRVMVVWEDAKFEALGQVVERVVRVGGTSTDTRFPRVLNRRTRGNGQFGHYVKVTWTNCRYDLSTDSDPVDHLICVVDADKLHDLIPSVTKPPMKATEVADWHANASSSWQTWLRSHCDPSGPPATTVHGVVLRWAKESLVLASYDQGVASTHLEIDAHAADVAELLQEMCPVQPSAVPPILFTDTFQRPLSCLDLLRRVRKLGPLKKNAPAIDDALRALSRESLAIVRARVPDLDALATLIWNLHRSESRA